VIQTQTPDLRPVVGNPTSQDLAMTSAKKSGDPIRLSAHALISECSSGFT